MGTVQAENAWRPSALVGAAALKWRCVVGILHDGVITLSKSLGLVGLPFWQVEKIVCGESAALLNLCSLPLAVLATHHLVDFPSFRILSRRNVMEYYSTYMA